MNIEGNTSMNTTIHLVVIDNTISLNGLLTIKSKLKTIPKIDEHTAPHLIICLKVPNLPNLYIKQIHYS